MNQGQRFRRRALRRGYKVEEVDAFLDRVEAALGDEPAANPVSSQDVHDVVFRVRFGGYDEWQVDLHLDRVERQLAEVEERGPVRGGPSAPDHVGRPVGDRMAPMPGRVAPSPGMPRDDRMPPSVMSPSAPIRDERVGRPTGPMPARPPIGAPAGGGLGRYDDGRDPAGDSTLAGQPFDPVAGRGAGPARGAGPMGNTYGSSAMAGDGRSDLPPGGYEPGLEARPGRAAPAGREPGFESRGSGFESREPGFDRRTSREAAPGRDGGFAPHPGDPRGGDPRGGDPRGGDPRDGDPRTGRGYGPDQGAGADGRGGYGQRPSFDRAGAGSEPGTGGPVGQRPGFDTGGFATGSGFDDRPPFDGFEAGRHGRADMTSEIRLSGEFGASAAGMPAQGALGGDAHRVDELRRSFQPRRFGSGYDPRQVDRLFEGIASAMSARSPVAITDADLDPGQFDLVSGGYFEAEVDQALREVRDIIRRH